MDEESLDKIAANTGYKLQGAFVTFGSASAGVIAIIKFVADTLIHEYALHKIYRWNLHLVGALWDLSRTFCYTLPRN